MYLKKIFYFKIFYNDLTINQLRFILLCIKAKADKRKIKLMRETELGLNLVDIISEYERRRRK
jgi:hypothetical protein